MRTPSRAGVLPAVSLVLLTTLAGCAGDGPDQGPKAQGTGPDQGSTGSSGEHTKVRDCRVTVALTGAVTRRLQGVGRAIYDNGTGPKAFYQFTSGDISVQVYSSGENFTPSVVISTKSGSFTSDPGTEGLHVSTTGRSAEVDSDTVGLGESSEGVHVKAVYDCA